MGFAGSDERLSTEEIYDGQSTSWQRKGPVLLSDFTARPFLLEWCAPVDGRAVLDLGCGEGYMARALADRGARRVLGIDVSSEMIERAKEAEGGKDRGLEFRAGDASTLRDVEAGAFDLAIAVFLFNYLTVDEMTAVMIHKDNVYCEVHGWRPKYHHELFKRELNTRVKNKIMFGSDYPSIPYERIFREWDELGYKPEVMEKIYHGNAERILGL